jgi:hypothetical protein
MTRPNDTERVMRTKRLPKYRTSDVRGGRGTQKQSFQTQEVGKHMSLIGERFALDSMPAHRRPEESIACLHNSHMRPKDGRCSRANFYSIRRTELTEGLWAKTDVFQWHRLRRQAPQGFYEPVHASASG